MNPMSSTLGDYPERLSLAEQVERIERMNEETRRFVAEAHKFAAERDKLQSEGRSLDQDPAIAPITLLVAILGGFAACFAAGATFMRAGWAS